MSSDPPLPQFNLRPISPCIVMPNKAFLVGVIYGIDFGRRMSVPTDPSKGMTEPIYMGNEDKREDFNAMYHGSLLQMDCAKCSRFYTYENPNEIPEHNVLCATEGCDNVLILYGVNDLSQMRLGNRRLVG